MQEKNEFGLNLTIESTVNLIYWQMKTNRLN